MFVNLAVDEETKEVGSPRLHIRHMTISSCYISQGVHQGHLLTPVLYHTADLKSHGGNQFAILAASLGEFPSFCMFCIFIMLDHTQSEHSYMLDVCKR